MEIKGFSSYYYREGMVFWKKDNKEVRPHTRADGTVRIKLKNDLGEFKGFSFSKLKFLAGDILQLPEDAVKAAYCEWLYVTPNGRFYSFNPKTPSGVEVIPNINGCGQKRLYTRYKGETKAVACHKIMCETFIDKDYIKKGLVCMHLDDDKTNFKLSNLKVGTYSENNKSAYDNGLNKGKWGKSKKNKV